MVIKCRVTLRVLAPKAPEGWRSSLAEFLGTRDRREAVACGSPLPLLPPDSVWSA